MATRVESSLGHGPDVSAKCTTARRAGGDISSGWTDIATSMDGDYVESPKWRPHSGRRWARRGCTAQWCRRKHLDRAPRVGPACPRCARGRLGTPAWPSSGRTRDAAAALGWSKASLGELARRREFQIPWGRCLLASRVLRRLAHELHRECHRTPPGDRARQLFDFTRPVTLYDLEHLLRGRGGALSSPTHLSGGHSTEVYANDPNCSYLPLVLHSKRLRPSLPNPVRSPATCENTVAQSLAVQCSKAAMSMVTSREALVVMAANSKVPVEMAADSSIGTKVASSRALPPVRPRRGAAPLVSDIVAPRTCSCTGRVRRLRGRSAPFLIDQRIVGVDLGVRGHVGGDEAVYGRLVGAFDHLGANLIRIPILRPRDGGLAYGPAANVSSSRFDFDMFATLPAHVGLIDFDRCRRRDHLPA